MTDIGIQKVKEIRLKETIQDMRERERPVAAECNQSHGVQATRVMVPMVGIYLDL